MIKLILFLIHISSTADSGPLKDIQTSHGFLPSFELEARKIMNGYKVSGGKFVFLTPYGEDIKLENDFSIVFLDKITWNGQEFPSRMSFSYWNNERAPLPADVTLTRMSEPRSFKYADASCVSLTIGKKYVSCDLNEKYPFEGGYIANGNAIAFPMVPVSQKPKMEYVWLLSGPTKIYRKKYPVRSILKIEGKKIIFGEDENTASLDWGGKSD